jgi:hypothetical protein
MTIARRQQQLCYDCCHLLACLQSADVYVSDMASCLSQLHEAVTTDKSGSSVIGRGSVWEQRLHELMSGNGQVS